jgi:uncharacterized protein (TIGR02391 family)
MARRILDQKLMAKVAKKLGKKDLVSINKLVSARAARDHVSSEVALILIADGHGIGTATFRRKLSPDKASELQRAHASKPAPAAPAVRRVGTPAARPAPSERTYIKKTINSLIADPELHERCADILLGSKNFDRAVNQATLVLEDRIRKKAPPPTSLVGENLVSFAFNEDLAKTVLQVGKGDKDDQRGFTQIMRGVVPAFRNKTHHHIVETFSREEAMRVCGFIDVLLRVVDGSTKLK